MSMLAVLMCTIVVLTLSTVAVQQTVGSLHVTAQGRELVQTVDAAHAGIQAELAVIHSLDAAPTGTTIPCTNSKVTVGTSGDAAATSSYTLSMSDPGAKTSATSANLVACGSAHTFKVPTNLDPWYVLLQSVGTSTGASANGLANGRTLQALVEVADSNDLTTTTTTIAPTTTVAAPTTTVAPTTTTVAPSTYTSNASAQALNLALGGTSIAYLTPATTVTNTGSGSNSATVVNPTVSLPLADNFLSVPVAAQIAEANTDGSSYSCAGVLSSGRTLSGGSTSGACAIGGSGSGGVSLDISGIPGVSSAADITSGTISIGGLTLNLDGAASWATGSTGGSTLTGSATLVNASVTVSATVTLLGVRTAVNVNLPLNLTSPLTGATNMVTAITNAIAGNSVLSAIAAPLATSLGSVLSLTADYQSTTGGVLTVSALHIGIVGSTVSADLAESTVGVNSVNTPATTTTTTSTTVATTTTVPGATTTTSTTVALPANGMTVEYIKQVP